MRRIKPLIAACPLSLTACTPLVLAPGAAQVRVTNLPADVTGCTAVGNVRVPEETSGMLDAGRAVGTMQNQTIGFGGNVALVTEGTPRMPVAGIAYKCPSS